MHHGMGYMQHIVLTSHHAHLIDVHIYRVVRRVAIGMELCYNTSFTPTYHVGYKAIASSELLLTSNLAHEIA